MLIFEQIVAGFAPHLRETKARGILREYLQYMILQALYTSKYGKHLVFLGGTCLRIVYGSQRFSEDLDFDNRGLSEQDWQEMGDMIIRFLHSEGLEAENQTVYKGAFHCYIKIPHILQKFDLSTHHDEKIMIQIDTVAQGHSYEPVVQTIEQFGLSIPLLATPKETLLSQKIRAAYERKRTKGRDFYDIRYLMNWGVEPDFSYLSAKMCIHNSEELQAYMLEHNARIDFESLTRDLEPFLFRSDDLRLVREFPAMVERMKGPL